MQKTLNFIESGIQIDNKSSIKQGESVQYIIPQLQKWAAPGNLSSCELPEPTKQKTKYCTYLNDLTPL